MSHAELKIRVTPRSSQNKVELKGDEIKVWTTASPTDGQANQSVCDQIAKALKVPKINVQVLKGQTARDKTLCVEGLSTEEALQRLRQ